MVIMVAFQAIDPGSIPGHRIFLKHAIQNLLNMLKRVCITKDFYEQPVT